MKKIALALGLGFATMVSPLSIAASASNDVVKITWQDFLVYTYTSENKFKEKKYKESIQLKKSLYYSDDADDNMRKVQAYFIGLMYAAGDGDIPVNKTEANKWLTKSCNLGEAESCNLKQTLRL